MTIQGNITFLNRGLILHQVNCQGAMNSGVAKALRDKHPAVFTEYSKFCRAGMAPEDVLGCAQFVQVSEELYVGNLFGQLTYGYDRATRYTSYDALDGALTKTAEFNRSHRLPVHFPLIGSDRGGAHWPAVKAIIEHRLGEFDLHLWLLPGMKEPT